MELIQIFPSVDFHAQCPDDETPLSISGVAIPGMRCLADAVCPACQTKYYIDLPVGQALWTPFLINRVTKKVGVPLETGELKAYRDFQWFSNPLIESFLNQNTATIRPQIHKFHHAERIVLVNCIDFLYGHALLKLLNVQRYLDRYPNIGCCVLVPTQLVHLVPNGVAEIWEVPIRFQDGWQWFSSLQAWIEQQLRQYQACFLSPAYSHPSHRYYDLRRFVKNLPDISSELGHCQPVIVFNYREDRLWGVNLLAQEVNLRALYRRLSNVFPDMAFIIIGFGQHHRFQNNKAKLIDLRTNSFTIAQDRLWLAYMSAADCAIGVHGSNMLLPSGLAKTTLEFMPRSRIGSAGQDLLFAAHCTDPREAVLKYHILYGDEFLSDLQPSVVTDVVSTLVSYTRLNQAFFRFGETSDTNAKFLNAIYNDAVFTRHKTYFQQTNTASFWMRTGRHLAESVSKGFDYLWSSLRL